MAKPPEPLEDVLPLARWVVEAEVREVRATGPTPPAPAHARPRATSVGYQSASQEVTLAVTRVLRGEPARELFVHKPEAGYLLRVGNAGVFLLDGEKTILGRYGPDSWSLEQVQAQLVRSGAAET